MEHIRREGISAGKYAAEEAGGGGGEALCQPFSQPVGGVSDGEHAEGAPRKPATSQPRQGLPCLEPGLQPAGLPVPTQSGRVDRDCRCDRAERG